jgi:hypothetical protein
MPVNIRDPTHGAARTLPKTNVPFGMAWRGSLLGFFACKLVADKMMWNRDAAKI